MAASWLRDAVFYEIYPQSFRDSNGDGIGDFAGIREKLPYIKGLGCNALWINPCFDSPFKDAGYDVRDFYKAAPRYGTNEELAELFQEAHALGIHVLLDLVPCHTSEEHPWFRRSCEAEPNEMWNRFIWTDHCFAGGDGMAFIGGEAPRSGTYIISFFKCQPALNYGYHEIHQRWQQPIDSPDALMTREAMSDVMRFWLDLGCDGFRVDMAGALVKNDPEKIGTMAAWQAMLEPIHRDYPEAAFVSEWSEPERSLSCGFDMDFYLTWPTEGFNAMVRDYKSDSTGRVLTENKAYFVKDSTRDVQEFLADYLPTYEATRNKGLWCLLTCNHDTLRPSAALTSKELALVYGWIFTMPGAPYLYYGDEIGMRYRRLPTKEGGYFRTGSRAPMQWTRGKNLGFSDAPAEELYLPVDPAEDAPTVESQDRDPDSLLNLVRRLTALRHSREDLQNYAPFAVYSAEPGSRLFAYKRGRLLVALNPGVQALPLALDGRYRPLLTVGSAEVSGSALTLGPQSFTVLEPIA